MGVLLSYLSRLWRRKSTLLGILAGLFIFLACVQFSGHFPSSSSSPSTPSSSNLPWESGSSKLKPHAAFQKKLLYQEQQLEQQQQRGVQFLPGVPGHTKLRKPSPEQQQQLLHGNTDSELDYYKEKNRQLYEAQAKAAKAKSKLDSVRRRGDAGGDLHIQPMVDGGDGSVEFERDQVGGGDAMAPPPPPPYREDVGVGKSKQAGPYTPKERLIHFDLKGAPPKMDYIVKVMQLSKKLGATGVLIEYEDMFPFYGKLANVSAGNAYSKADIQQFISSCQQLELELIPIIQTFGHMEFVLKHAEFAHLRDVPAMPESICPCHKESMWLVREIIDQVMSMHKDVVDRVHIGCDEVFHLGECQPCQGNSRSSLFVSHTASVAKYVRDVYHKQPIIWDDMLRNLMPIEMEPLAGLVEPMVWVYAEDVYRFVPSYTWDRFAEVFSTTWTASASKGAHGSTLMVPNVQRHLTNNLNWLELMSEEESKFTEGFRGIVITAWQRYDHFGVLCELFPVGLPSLAVDLLATRDGYFNASNQAELFKTLECVGTYRNLDEPIDLDADPFLYERMSWCYFPGAAVFKMAQSLESTQKEVDDFMKKVKKDHAWMTDYNIRRNYSTTFRVDEVMEDWPMVFNGVVKLIQTAKQSLSEVYDEYTVAEWIEQKIYPLYQQLKELKQQAEWLKVRRIWPARPLEPLKELAPFGIEGPPSKSNAAAAAAAAAAAPAPVLSNKMGGAAAPSMAIVNGQTRLYQPQQQPALGVRSPTARPKRLVQMPDNYRYPPGSRQ